MKDNQKKKLKRLLIAISESSQNATSSSVIMYHPAIPKTIKKNDK